MPSLDFDVAAVSRGQSGRAAARRRSARAFPASSARAKAAQPFAPTAADRRQRLRLRLLPAAQSGRRGRAASIRSALPDRRLEGRPQSERAVRHRRLSRDLHRRGGRRHQSARSLSLSSAGTKAAIRRSGSTRPPILRPTPDVAAAQVDPLVHFLQFGIHEGRSPMRTGCGGRSRSCAGRIAGSLRDLVGGLRARDCRSRRCVACSAAARPSGRSVAGASSTGRRTPRRRAPESSSCCRGHRD